jgi:hypothetical protein
LWEILERSGYPKHLVNATQSLYQNTKIMLNVNMNKREEIIDQGVRQGCGVSPSLFNIYIYNLIRKWKEQIKTGIKLKQKQHINTSLFADDQILIQDKEDNLQQSVYTLHNISKEYNFKISIKKTKVMVFKGKFPIRTKIVIDNNILEQVSHLNYLGN